MLKVHGTWLKPIICGYGVVKWFEKKLDLNARHEKGSSSAQDKMEMDLSKAWKLHGRSSVGKVLGRA